MSKQQPGQEKPKENKKRNNE